MRKNNVLIVDDDNYTIQLYNMLIEWLDFKEHVLTELNASTALSKLKTFKEETPEKFPDYILLDLRMPDMHGFEFIEKFEKAFPDRKEKTSFIITSSSIIHKDKVKAFTYSGVKEFLVKPIPDDFLERLVKNGLESA